MKAALAGCALVWLVFVSSCGRIGYQAQRHPDAAPGDATMAAQDAAADVVEVAADRAGTADGPDGADGRVGDTAVPASDGPDAGAANDAPRDLPNDLPNEAPNDVPNEVPAPSDGAVDADSGAGGCAARTLCTVVEPFDQTPQPSRFTLYSDGTCSSQVSAGALHVAATGVAGRYCGIETVGSLIPTGTIAIDSAAFPPNVSGFVVYFDLQDGAANAVEFQLAIGSLNLNVNNATTSTRKASVTYNAAVHRFWRFRADASPVACESSPDGTTWTTLVAVPPPFTGDVFVNFGAGFVLAGTSASVALPGLNAP